MYEKRIREVIKQIDGERSNKEHMKNKHGEQWTYIVLSARNSLKKNTPIMIKCAARLNLFEESIK